MKKGERAFFYHTGDEKQVVGIVEVIREHYPDPTDAKGVFKAVDIKAVEKLPKPVTLAQVKADKQLKTWRWRNIARLSVQPVTARGMEDRLQDGRAEELADLDRLASTPIHMFSNSEHGHASVPGHCGIRACRFLFSVFLEMRRMERQGAPGVPAGKHRRSCATSGVPAGKRRVLSVPRPGAPALPTRRRGCGAALSGAPRISLAGDRAYASRAHAAVRLRIDVQSVG